MDEISWSGSGRGGEFDIYQTSASRQHLALLYTAQISDMNAAYN